MSGNFSLDKKPVDKPDVNQLSDIFFEAAETERKLPAAIRKQKLSSWHKLGKSGAHTVTKISRFHCQKHHQNKSTLTSALFFLA